MKKYSLFIALLMFVHVVNAHAATMQSVQFDAPYTCMDTHTHRSIQGWQSAGIKNAISIPTQRMPKYPPEYLRVAQNDTGNSNSSGNNSARNDRRNRNKNRVYLTYTKTNPTTNKAYSGRTSGFGSPGDILKTMDAHHHMNDQGFGQAQMDRYSKNKYVMRSREKQLIKANQDANRHVRSSDGVSQ